MKKSRSAPNYICNLKYLILFIIALCCSGCATTNLRIDLNIISDSSKEIGAAAVKERALKAEYCGQETINDKQFHRYMISGTRSTCRYNSNIDMLLPIEIGEDSKVFFREASLNNKCIKQQPAQIYYYFLPPLNISLENLLIKNPSQIFIVRARGSESEMKVHYKYTSKDQMVRYAALNADSSDLKWNCRDKGVYVMNCVLLPFAVVVDVITLPLQLILINSLRNGR